MSCDDARRRLTAYLDGELDADRGTLVRGHLRGCEACRRIAADEAALRDSLRALPTLDPPPSLWAGVQAQLAAAEQAEAARPWWRRAAAKWAPAVPRFAAGGLVAAAAVAVVWWRTDRGPDHGDAAGPARDPRSTVAVHPAPDRGPDRGTDRGTDRGPDRGAPAEPPSGCSSPEAGDVTADLALDGARMAACYAAAAEELLALAGEARAGWTDGQRAAFDAKVETLRQAIDAADEGKPRQRAWRAMVRYLQNALARDELVALASGGMP